MLETPPAPTAVGSPRLGRRHDAFTLATFAVVLLLLLAVVPAVAQAPDAYALLRQPGHAAFLRHAATTGGYGDPAGYRIEDCATQRPLVDAGRAQARRTRAALAANGVTFDRVLTSPWCRCKETAALVTGREGEVMQALANLVGRTEHRDAQVTALKAYLAGLNDARALFVTHGIVVSALVGINPAEGEMVIVRLGAGGAATVVGRLRVD
jgi:phosphohistidine phosphatase SixA